MWLQVTNCDIVKNLIDSGDTYYAWLCKKSGIFEPLANVLAKTDFESINGLDDVFLKATKEGLREAYSEEMGDGLEQKDIDMIRKSVRGECCLLEIIVNLGKCVNDMVSLSSEDETPKYISMMLHNAHLDTYSEEDYKKKPDIVKAFYIMCASTINTRMYSKDGEFGLFHIPKYAPDMRTVSLWQQMNDWVDTHTDEEGEWID